MKIFVSHSSKDQPLAEALVDLLRHALPVPPEEIRCTSVDGHRLPAGAKTDEVLRHEVGEAETFIGLITASSVESFYVLFELGARWGAAKHLAPLLGGAADSSFLRGPLSGYNALRCENSSQLHQLIENLASALEIKGHAASTYVKQVERLREASAQNAKESVHSKSIAPEQSRKLNRDELDILRVLSLNDGEFLEEKQIIDITSMDTTECRHYLQKLSKEKYITRSRDIYQPIRYSIWDKGREYMVENKVGIFW